MNLREVKKTYYIEIVLKDFLRDLKPILNKHNDLFEKLALAQGKDITVTLENDYIYATLYIAKNLMEDYNLLNIMAAKGIDSLAEEGYTPGQLVRELGKHTDKKRGGLFE